MITQNVFPVNDSKNEFRFAKTPGIMCGIILRNQHKL